MEKEEGDVVPYYRSCLIIFLLTVTFYAVIRIYNCKQ